ncbi:DUF1993 domain-containing protein [Scandinavium sp. V105_16]|uniref:DUF1993 domain-containing protein n=1 Tax=Scandinavium lactucae TaxID=3095028 RepID=A0AAJ2VYN8_9ENTR|nr:MULTISPECIES: DUF1993 domain-containing protein [unclassified Scandinavium]MDX6021402.1 DUF1993 domain-containing protein [Scandinavium sp. V105_16]MDX6033098.1 DUF1993 domain-containing protein [Scandinavium sp. V105_12]
MSLYSETKAQFIHGLQSLNAVLEKSAVWAKEQGVEEATLLDAKLADDMFPLKRQVQVSCDMAKRTVARLANVDAPVMDDNESTFAQLHERIAATVAFMKSVQDSQLDGDDERPIMVQAREHQLHFTARSYVFQFAVPNFYFHTTTAYGILRQAGVPLGKRDFLGKIQ